MMDKGNNIQKQDDGNGSNNVEFGIIFAIGVVLCMALVNLSFELTIRNLEPSLILLGCAILMSFVFQCRSGKEHVIPNTLLSLAVAACFAGLMFVSIRIFPSAAPPTIVAMVAAGYMFALLVIVISAMPFIEINNKEISNRNQETK